MNRRVYGVLVVLIITLLSGCVRVHKFVESEPLEPCPGDGSHRDVYGNCILLLTDEELRIKSMAYQDWKKLQDAKEVLRENDQLKNEHREELDRLRNENEALRDQLNDAQSAIKPWPVPQFEENSYSQQSSHNTAFPISDRNFGELGNSGHAIARSVAKRVCDRYDALFKEYGGSYAMLYKAVAIVESNCQQTVSDGGSPPSVGIMQVQMRNCPPESYVAPGNVYTPRNNIACGIKYFEKLGTDFDYNTIVGRLIAYNQGPRGKGVYDHERKQNRDPRQLLHFEYARKVDLALGLLMQQAQGKKMLL